MKDVKQNVNLPLPPPIAWLQSCLPSYAARTRSLGLQKLAACAHCTLDFSV